MAKTADLECSHHTQKGTYVRYQIHKLLDHFTAYRYVKASVGTLSTYIFTCQLCCSQPGGGDKEPLLEFKTVTLQRGEAVVLSEKTQGQTHTVAAT